MNQDSAEGFVFHFGCEDSHATTSAASAARTDSASAVPPSSLSPFQSARDVVLTWLSAYPVVAPRQLTLQLADTAVVRYQTAARVEALEGGDIEPRDIVPGKYYGGLKVWSCAPDLAAYIHSHSELVVGKRVLEVGCGQAVPLIAAALCGAATVTGHDYNREVIEICTLPNLAASLALHPEVQCDVQTGFGDWDSSFLDEADIPMDVIIGSDVTYDPVACTKLAALLVRLLPREGIALIATKQYYFGTNGGLAEFEDAVRSASNGTLVVQHVLRLGDGNEMQRLVVSVHWEH
jgi:predicted nicotinamide N-methyase